MYCMLLYGVLGTCAYIYALYSQSITSIVYHCIGLLVTCCLRSWYLLLYRDLMVLLEAQVAVESREIGETEDLADLLDHPEMTESP